MNADQIILEVQENASEWLEMSDEPFAIVAGVLANKVISLQSHIEYLERRLKYASSNK